MSRGLGDVYKRQPPTAPLSFASATPPSYDKPESFLGSSTRHRARSIPEIAEDVRRLVGDIGNDRILISTGLEEITSCLFNYSAEKAPGFVPPSACVAKKDSLSTSPITNPSRVQAVITPKSFNLRIARLSVVR